jgi:OmcA/MtrC family decaheme c-type cytochrome
MAGLLALSIAGCGGGSDGAAGAPGAAGATGATGATGPAGGTGTGAAGTVNVGSNTVAASADAAAAWKALAPQVTISSVTINSPAVVKFTVKDAAGNPVVGLGNKSQSSSATVAGLTNLSFTLAKLVPAANGAPSKWVSYNVVRPLTVAEKTTVPATASCNADKTWCGTYPTTDTQGTLADNGDGSYQYTFYRNSKDAATIVAGLTDSVDGLSKKADLGDVSFDATQTHRLGLVISGNAPGTGSNTPTGAASATAAVAMANPANAVFDFIPATGKAVTATDTSRDIVKIESCASCHDGKPLAHGGSRKDPKLCVTCHTDQVKYSFDMEAPMLADGITFATQTGSNAVVRPAQAVLMGRAVGNFPNYIHKLHMADKLTKQGYNYNNDGGPMNFNTVTYPQPVTNCVQCHDGSTNAVSKTPVTANGDNWKSVPSRLACGSCHDGIDFATGNGIALGTRGQAVGGHVGGAQLNDATCAVCHTAATIPVYHVTVDPTGANGRGGYPLNTANDVPTPGYPKDQGPTIPVASQLGALPAGVFKINFEIKSVTVADVTGGKQATVVYRMFKDGSKVTFNATGNLIDNVDGNPGIYLTYGTPVDGVTTPVDWNGPTSAVAKFKELRIGTGGTQTGPDADGYYTAVLSYLIPSTAKMITAAVGVEYNGLVQLGLDAYPKGIRLREPAFAMMTATGYTARRAIVSNAKCNSCHGQLGVSPSFHSGARNNGEGCAICHQPSTAGGHGATGWSVSVKNLVHSIHGSAKRDNAFTYQATIDNPAGFGEVGYPGVLNKCEKCHVAGSYDFSAAANSAAQPNLLWTTDSNGNMTTAPALGRSPWVTTLADYTSDNLVSSPMSSSCFGCHDTKSAVAHMQYNGGTLVSPASTVSTGGRANGFSKVESCMVCHASGKVADIKAVHAN